MKPKKYKIKIREEFNGLKIKPEVMELQGEVVELVRLWKIDTDDTRYPGEYAMGTLGVDNDILSDAGIDWIASGDVERI